MRFLLKLEKYINYITSFVGAITIIAMILMIFNVFYDVISRYFFRTNSIAMQEMEWHLFSVIILLGVAYTLKEDGHVRVDIIYDRLSESKKALINMIGTILFILPIALLVGLSSIDNAKEAYLSMEQSGNPGGLKYRWIIKSLIPVAFLMLIISSIGFFIKNLITYIIINYPASIDLKSPHKEHKELKEHKDKDKT